ncbi:GSCOCG00009963001-RA-CDS [Cotesia congregata]|uniref:Similar to ARMC5: Armadillo repeat-containing protein 5 (Homo sapiens) n=1 Tax=Cotesia congregata TaxID=51543 RepID=A0A8J2MKK6_COTCN|nr:GSCOCG00009963001-RA-CDS [Cotesia congregata]CAG5090964.1 Similar to ARMC5: Armadillo repeat-containing protein 5 (Homo sapiens) [Cotesia congregata]
MSRKSNNNLSIVAELSRHIETGSKTGIITCLTTIKNESKIFELFITDKGLDVVIKLLKYQSSKVLDIALSILANAFLRESVREQVHETSIANNVVWIIKNLSPGLTLHCRACRLIGNMSDSKRHTKALCEAGVIVALKGIILDAKTSTPTLLMSIRALRNIWNINEESHAEILDLNLVKAVTDILVSSKSKQLDSSNSEKYKDIIETCLKALRSFSDTSNSRSGEQMRGKDLRGYQCIVELCKTNSRIAFQLLYKLCRVANHRPALGSVGVVECIIDFLKLKTNLNSFRRELIASFCLLSREAVNRLRIREEGGLELMLNLLAESDNEIYHPALLHALTQFLYDENSILIIIKNGIVGVLTDRLKRMINDLQLESNSPDNTSESSSTSRKRRAKSPAYKHNKSDVKYNRINSGRFSLDFPIQWSPSSVCSSTSSPTSSPPLPNYDNYDNNENPTDEDNYSPVCSDDEDWIGLDNNNGIEDNSLKSISTALGKDEIADDDEIDDPNDLVMETPEVNFSHMWTLILLAKLALHSDPIEGLADSATIQALTSYMELSKNHRAPSILNRILKNHVYFLPLLLQGFVFEAQLLDDSQNYLQILGNVAEQGGAFGELAATLIRGQETDKYIIAISVPFLLKSRDKLRLLLDTYGGLDIIFKLLKDRNHLLNDNSVLSICQLANNLGIVPETFEKGFTMKDNESNENLPVDKDKKVIKNNVTFELDDGGTVDACRHLLCLKSQVFSAMFNGNFYETGKKRVRLQNVSKGGFIVLYLAASGHLFSNIDNDDNDDDDKVKIESLLDAVLLADRFLMINELDKLTETSLMRISYSNLNRAWNWARENHCSELKTYCVTNFLTKKLSREHRLSAFNHFIDDKNFIEFLEEIKKIVVSQLLDRQ